MEKENLENRIILIDKEVGWTSNDVVGVLKKKLCPVEVDSQGKKVKKVLGQNEKRFRIGHAGTLDPFATGLLVILINDATKKFAEFQNLQKEYVAEVEFGKETDTYDVDGKTVSEYKGEIVLGEVATRKILIDNFSGKIIQTPPKYSALKINGKRMYDLMYSGKDIPEEILEKKKREVEIYEWEILKLEKNILTLRIVVSGGTYIRCIASDFGKLVGCGAYLKSLRRTRIGEYKIEDAKKVSEAFKECLTIVV